MPAYEALLPLYIFTSSAAISRRRVRQSGKLALEEQGGSQCGNQIGRKLARFFFSYLSPF
jgi:hypothetical protein